MSGPFAPNPADKNAPKPPSSGTARHRQIRSLATHPHSLAHLARFVKRKNAPRRRLFPAPGSEQLRNVDVKAQVGALEAVNQVNALVGGKRRKVRVALAGEQQVTADLIILVPGGYKLLRLWLGEPELGKVQGPAKPAGNFQIALDGCCEVHSLPLAAHAWTSGKLFQSCENLPLVRLLLQFVHLCPGNVPVLVHDENRPVIEERNRVLRRGKNAVRLGGLRVRPAVTGQRKAQPAEVLLKGNVRWNRIRVDAHDLGVEAGKLGEVRLRCRQFVLSNRSEIERVEKYDDVLASVSRKLKLALLVPGRRRQLEVRSRITCFERHLQPPCGIQISARAAFADCAALGTRRFLFPKPKPVRTRGAILAETRALRKAGERVLQTTLFEACSS